MTLPEFCPSPGEPTMTASLLSTGGIGASSSTGNPFTTEVIDLSSEGPKTVNGRVYGLIYRREGSSPGGRLHVDLGGGQFADLYPGARVMATVDGLTISRSSAGVTSGTARLVVLRSPNANFDEPEGSDPHVQGVATLVGPSGATTQAHNSTNNAPVVAATDGISIVGVEGIRFDVSAATAATAGTARVWWSDLSNWYLGLEAGHVDLQLVAKQVVVDSFVAARFGRAYVEMLSATNAGGGVWTVRAHTWGTR